MTLPEQTIAQRTDWRIVLEQEYSAVSERLQQAYGRMLQRLQPLADDLTNRIAEIVAAGENVTPEMVRGMNQYARLMARIEIEMNDFAAIARNECDLLIQRMLPLGADGALTAALSGAGEFAGALSGAWLRPDPETLARLLDITGSEAFQANWASFGANAAQTISDALLVGVAQGKGTAFTSRLLSQWLNMPFAWADNTIRTAQIWAYRLANHAGFAANSNIVEGWYWHASLDVRTCISCWDQHGSFHTNDEILNDHHRGRCGAVPKVRNLPAPLIELGSATFDRLPEDVQRQIMGKGMWDAWKRGDVQFGEFSDTYTDDVYGEMLRAVSLRKLGVVNS